MKVLAVDPGYGRCGVAVMEKTPSGETLLFSGCIETAKDDDFSERLAAVVAACGKLADEHGPDAIAIEKLYFSKNQKTAMRVAEVRGALIAMAGARDMPLFEYGPGQVKLATTGSGGADKKQMIRMVRMLMKMNDAARHDDEYDAIAIAMAHLALSRYTSL